MGKFDFLDNALRTRREQNLWREIQEISSPSSARVMIENREIVMFGANNYLDLANDPRVKQAAQTAAAQWGAGSGGSRLAGGAQPVHREFETAIAQFKHAEDALLFNSGYHANVGVISSLGQAAAEANPRWTIFSDALNHASIIDGCRLSRARIVVYRHNDMRDLREKAAQNAGAGMIVSDGVFSMDGDLAALPEILAIADDYDLLTVIDEAHSTGVIGKCGRGVGEFFNLSPDLLVGTSSKALGAVGGFVTGKKKLLDFFRQYARSFIFSTSLPAAAVAGALAALKILIAEPERLARLRRNLAAFYNNLPPRFLPATAPEKTTIANGGISAIAPVIIGDEARAAEISRQLFARNFFVPAIRYPTVSRGQARLRVTITAGHSIAEISALTAAIAACAA